MEPQQTRALGPDVAPPQRIGIGGELIMRRWAPGDLHQRFAAVTASFEHLHAWMDWLPEPPTLEGQRAFGERQAEAWPAADGGFAYGIFDARDGTLLAVLGLHDRIGPGALEIGYWCHVEHTGKGVITRAAATATRAALALPGIERVEIHCDEANVRSAAVPRRLGYRLDRIEDDEITAPAEIGRGMFWIMRARDFPGSPADRISAA